MPQTSPYPKPIQVNLEHILVWSCISRTKPCPKLTQMVLGYGQVWGIECPKFNHIPDSIWDIPSQIWDRSSKIEIPVWDVPNRNSDLGYPRFDLGHGKVWATTIILKQYFRAQLSRKKFPFNRFLKKSSLSRYFLCYNTLIQGLICLNANLEQKVSNLKVLGFFTSICPAFIRN